MGRTKRPAIQLKFEYTESKVAISMPLYSFIASEQEKARRDELRTRINQLKGRRSALKQMKAELDQLAQRKSLPLPPELMNIIFEYYVRFYGQLPEFLLLVCRTWHVLALSCRTLWTNLDLIKQFGLHLMKPWAGTFLQTRIARSNPVPLDVDFSNVSSIDMTSQVSEKIAEISTFRPRIRSLVMSRPAEAVFLIGDQPYLESLSLRFSEIPEQLLPTSQLVTKNITTLRFIYASPSSQWPDALLQRLHTLELVLIGTQLQIDQSLSMVKRIVNLRCLRIGVNYGSSTPFSHPSVRHLCLNYYSGHGNQPIEIDMPRLQRIDIQASYPANLQRLKLAEAPITSLNFGSLFHRSLVGQKDTTNARWVSNITGLLRRIPKVARITLSAPPDVMSLVINGLKEESSLCPELEALSVEEPMHPSGERRAQDRRKLLSEVEQVQTIADAMLAQRLPK